MKFLPSRVMACAGAFAFLVLGSSSASAVSSWDFTGGAGFMGLSEVFIADDGAAVTVSGFTQLFAETPDASNLTFPNVIHQTSDGIGVGLLGDGELGGDLDAIPPSFLCGFRSCVEFPALGLDVIRLVVGEAGWHAKSISISLFDDPENVWVFAGEEADGSDAVLLNMLDAVGGNPDIFELDDTDPHHVFFIAAVADIEECPESGFFVGGLCGTPSHLRIAGFVGEKAVPEPGAMALFGVGIVGMVMVRRRARQQA